MFILTWLGYVRIFNFLFFLPFGESLRYVLPHERTQRFNVHRRGIRNKANVWANPFSDHYDPRILTNICHNAQANGHLVEQFSEIAYFWINSF